MLMVLLSMSPYTFSNEASTYNTLTVALERIRVENDIPAMSVAIITAGEVTYIKGFGFLDEKQTCCSGNACLKKTRRLFQKGSVPAERKTCSIMMAAIHVCHNSKENTDLSSWTATGQVLHPRTATGQVCSDFSSHRTYWIHMISLYITKSSTVPLGMRGRV